MHDFAQGLPTGGTDIFQTAEKELGWGGTGNWPWIFGRVTLSSACVDAGNTPTTTLRKGLVLGKITASNLHIACLPSATDGSQFPVAVLAQDVNMLNPGSGSAESKFVPVIFSGPLRAAQLVSLTAYLRRHMFPRFMLDDDLVSYTVPFTKVVAKTADYTVTAADNNTLFTTEGAGGAVNFTLPTLAVGLRFKFFNAVNQNMVITGAADTIIGFNDIAATTLTFSTAGNKVGACVEVIANNAGTAWIAIAHGPNTVTPA
ncbi:MAG: head decoration protein [Planctomycetia bacterium]|nr:head decoration protein [Planctomycetia bacterium]